MTVNILHVEDNPADIELLADALDELDADVTVSTAKSGAAAIAMLAENREHAEAFVPDLMLLDLNLPEKSGREVLVAVRSEPRLKALPIIVLTTSSSARDVRDCYELGANAFVSKPADLGGFRELVSAIHKFWVASAIYPRRPPAP